MMIDYLDPERPLEERVESLLTQMNLAEKAALMFHPSTQPPSGDPGLKATAVSDIVERGITHFNVLGGEDSAAVAEWHNEIQEMAESTRLGIPITLSSDPRHGFRDNPFTGQALDSLSRWPEATGIGAIGTEEAAAEYGDTIRHEFLAMGIRVYLGPMADLFSEPRWSRGFGTWGEDPAVVATLSRAFIRGLRGGDRLTASSVAAVLKHFPGGGPQLLGDDAHDPRYTEQVYPGQQRERHIAPFLPALADGVSQVMTYYGKPVGTDWPEVGFAFNAPVVDGILRKRLGFEGIVVTDWNLLEATQIAGAPFGPNGWGLEDLEPIDRARIAVEAGVDQFGGDRCPSLIEQLVENGEVSEARIDLSVRRLLREKLRLGVFENRRVDVERAGEVCGSPVHMARGRAAQRDSLVLLHDRTGAPIPEEARLYVEGVDPSALGAGRVCATPEEADAIIVRLDAPFEPGRGSMGGFFRGGSLDFTPDVIARLRDLSGHAPLHVVVYLERPAILQPLLEFTTSLVGDFGANDGVVVDALLGRAPLRGRLPFDIPRSMTAVEHSREDVPFDTENPTFVFGDGIQREARATIDL